MERRNILPYESNQALEEERICTLLVDFLERYGEYIPYGYNVGIVEKITVEAAKLTPAVVSPTYYFGQIYETTMHRNVVSFPAGMPAMHLRMPLDQIAYNGSRKIMIINGHGGSRFWLQFLERMLLGYKRSYCLYVVDTDSTLNEEEHQALDEIYETEDDHAGETETSVCMTAMPGCVDLNRQILEEPIHQMGRMDGSKGVYTSYYFNVDWVEDVADTSSFAIEGKGEAALNIMIKVAARAVKTVQEDQEIPKLRQKILEKCGKMEEGRR